MTKQTITLTRELALRLLLGSGSELFKSRNELKDLMDAPEAESQIQFPNLQTLDQFKVTGTYHVGDDVVSRTVFANSMTVDFTDAVHDSLGRLISIRAGKDNDVWRRSPLAGGGFTPWVKELGEQK